MSVTAEEREQLLRTLRKGDPILLNLIRERGLGHAGSCPASYWLTYPIYGKGDQPCPICICGTDEYMEALGLPPPPEGE